MTEISDKDLLDMKLGGQGVRDMSALSFMGWIAEKLNGLPTYRADTQELLEAVRGAPMSRNMAEQEKCRLLRKLIALDVPLV